MRATDLFWCEHHQCDFVDQDDGDNVIRLSCHILKSIGKFGMID